MAESEGILSTACCQGKNHSGQRNQTYQLVASAICPCRRVPLSAKHWNWCCDVSHPLPLGVSEAKLVPGALVGSKVHPALRGSRGESGAPLRLAKEPNGLSPCFADVNQYRSHLGILLTFNSDSERVTETLHF